MIRRDGARIEVRVPRIPWPFPENVHAVTIWPLIFYEPQVWTSRSVQAHERYHWKDQLRWLVVPWLIAYGLLRLRYSGGRDHPLEREAYWIEDQARHPPI